MILQRAFDMSAISDSNATFDSEGLPTQEAVLNEAKKLIEKKQGRSSQADKVLDRLKPGLKELVEANVPFKTMYDQYIRKLAPKVSQKACRDYMRKNFDYPPQRAPRTPAKTVRSTAGRVTKPKATKTPAKRTARS